MKNIGSILARALIFLAFSQMCAHAQVITQQIVLNPGWNAIWIEAQPANTAPAAVFAGLPVDSVWTWSERVSATDFIQNPSTAGWNRNQWLVWLPTNNPAASVAVNLYAISAARAYLVKVSGTSSVTLQITGVVARQPTTWSSGQFNLRGFPVNPNMPATFRKFFEYSPGQWDALNNTTTPVYKLDSSGVWTQVSADDSMQRSQAYWVFSSGASTYDAPEGITALTGDEVFFSPLMTRTSLTLANRSDETRSIRFTALTANLGFQIANPLASDPSQAYTMVDGYYVQVGPNQTVTLNLYLDRTAQLAGSNQAVFSVDDGAGTLQYLGFGSDGAGLAAEGGLGATQTDTNGFPFAGLWIGTISVSAVGEVHATNALAPTPTPVPFTMRVLIHADTNGVCHLLKEVTVATLPSTIVSIISTNGLTVVTNSSTVAGPVVILSDPAIINLYKTRYISNPDVVVHHYTAVQFDDAASVGGSLMTGFFNTNGTLTVNLSIPSGYVTNPFYHKYHPDHDNLDPTYQHYVQEDLVISRSVEFDLTPVGTGVPAYGTDGLDGVYRERITGLNQVPILASGTFFIQRISNVGILNPPLQ